METYERWTVVPEISTPCGRVVLHADPAATSVRLVFSEIRGNPPRDLLVEFGDTVIAAASHDEAAHPWPAPDPASLPRLGEPKWERYTFPLLRVWRSRWLASFGDGQILDPERRSAIHYEFVSLDNIVDVLAHSEPKARWVSAAAA